MEILPKLHYIYLFKNSSEKRQTTNSMAYSYRRLRAGSTENRRVRMVSRLLLKRRGHTCISGPSPCAFPNIHPYHSLTSFRSSHKGHLFTEAFLTMLLKISTSLLQYLFLPLPSWLYFSSLQFIIFLAYYKLLG